MVGPFRWSLVVSIAFGAGFILSRSLSISSATYALLALANSLAGIVTEFVMINACILQASW